VGVPAVAQVRAFAAQRLPEFMIPAVFTDLASLPLTPTGKVDRASLPDLDGARPELEGFVAPAGASEELLAGIWAQVLGVDRVGALDDFFELGGHSLLATQVVSRVREVFAVEMSLVALFDHPTVRGLAGEIEGSRRGVVAPPIERVGRDEV